MAQEIKTTPQAPVEVGKGMKEGIRGQVQRQNLSPAQGIVPYADILDEAHTVVSSQSQNIIFDVSQPLDDIQAPRESVKSTAIALVRVDSTFLPGTTIGATHWVAYAMTKGTVCVRKYMASTHIALLQAGFV
jgi:hypothetical protein